MDITFSQVNFKYQEEYVLKDINLEIPSSKFTVFLGPSGSGKSTLLKLINGLLKPTEGRVSVENHINDLQINKKRLQLLLNDVGYVFQNPEEQFFAETVEEELYYGPNNKKISKLITKKNIDSLFNLFDLDSNYLRKSPRKLSGGEMRKVAIIINLLMEQNIILLDEPTAGLDNKSKHSIFKYLKHINQNTGKTIVITTHEIDLALQVADYIFLIEDGKIIKCGDPIEILLERNRNPELQGFFRTPYLELLNELEKQFNVNLPYINKDIDSLINLALRGD